MVKLVVLLLSFLCLVGCSNTSEKDDLVRYSLRPAGELNLPDVDAVTKNIDSYAQLVDTAPTQWDLHTADWIVVAIEARQEGSWKLTEKDTFVDDVVRIVAALGSDFLYTQTDDGWVYVDYENEEYSVAVVRTPTNAFFVYTT